ncbi:MAG: diaminopimelate epimerase [Fimbriimonadaceae bacterium]|nr:diaminopimelate epimerase [Fimbriimonadaceae bacterium]
MIPFVKMHGIGNDFVMLDNFTGKHGDVDFQALARATCDRHFGVGADGLIVGEYGDGADFRMRMWNPDGSESEMCGNGIRCFGLMLHDKALFDKRSVTVDTGAGVLTLVSEKPGCYTVSMGSPRWTRAEIGMSGNPKETFINQPLYRTDGPLHGTAVSTGNPHLVIRVEDVQAVELHTLGPLLESDPLFINRTNVHFVQVQNREHVIQRTWERGAGVTLACGTGACAAVAALHRQGFVEPKCSVRLPGGELTIELKDNVLWMTGPATTVFEGVWSD